MMKMRLGFILVMLIACTINAFLPNVALTAIIVSLCVVCLVELAALLVMMRRAIINVKLTELVNARGGAPSVLTVAVNNRFFLGSPSVSLIVKARNLFREDYAHECFTFPIAPNDTTVVEIPLFCEHCGKTELTIEKMRFCDGIGFFSFSKHINNICTMVTLPQPISLDAIFEPSEGDDLSGSEYSDYLSGDDRSMVFDYHEYRAGDNTKDINWKLSARLETTMVKEFSLPIASSVGVIVELAYFDVLKLDNDIAMLYALSERLHDMGHTHSICWFCDRRGMVSTQVDRTLAFDEEFFGVLDTLYETKPSKISSLDVYLETVIDHQINTIYATDTLTDEVADRLVSFSNNTKLIVFYTNKFIPISTTIIAKFEENDIALI